MPVVQDERPHEVGSDFEMPLSTFSGRNQDLSVWSARFEAHVKLSGWTGVLAVAAAQTGPKSMEGASEEAIVVSKILYLVAHDYRRQGPSANPARSWSRSLAALES